MRRIVLAAIAALVLAGPAGATTTPPRLVGTVGPGFTITLKRNGVIVRTLTPRRYTFVIRDRSNIHNFHLKGPGLNRVLTGIAFVGTRTVTLSLLRRGIYTYVCDPHDTSMRRTFRVR
jgi:hypothetical protein